MTTYDSHTPAKVRDILNRAITSQPDRRLRLFYGDPATGEAWQEEYDTIGTISRSTGPKHVPILIANKRSTGGGAISTANIVGIQWRAGQWLYKHPSLDLGKWTKRASNMDGYVETVLCNGSIVARFKRDGQADRYINFMTGKRWNK